MKTLLQFLQKHLETATLVSAALSLLVLAEMWRRPLTAYLASEDLTMIKEGNCRKVMMAGAALILLWTALLAARVVFRDAPRRKALRWLPLAGIVMVALAGVRAVMAAQVYPWFWD